MLLFSFTAVSQTDSLVRARMKSWYAVYGICTDSVKTPLLYEKAYEWAGTRYRYSGHNKKGIDCSGFVCEMYKQVYGTKLSGGSKDLWPLTRPVHRDSLREADLLFFKIRKGRISHVGLYLGNNKMVHASVKHGVIISGLDEAYYKKYYFSAGRLKGKSD